MRVTVSPGYEVTIPRSLCERLGVAPGQELDVFVYDGRIEMLPVRKPEELRGMLAGIDTTVEREPDRV